jgi:hypothetical protein
VTLDEKEKIKAINVFVNSEPSVIITRMNDKLGHYIGYLNSGLPGYSQHETYVWESTLGIRFLLSVSAHLGSSEKTMGLLIYSKFLTEAVGELGITEWRS